MLKLIKKYKNIIFIIGGFFFGFSLSGGLLLYSGKELVNVLIYFTFVIALPALLSISSFLLFLIKKDYAKLQALRLSLLSGVFFSFGALSSLLLTVITQDIAFGWSTTLNIDAKSLKSILDKIAFWSQICSSCAVDEKLIELSRFTRLGSALTKEQISNAILLGQWWKFLAMSILVYGIFLRGLLYLLSFTFKKSKITITSNIKKDDFKPQEQKAKVLNSSSLRGDFRVIPYNLDSFNINLPHNKDAKDIVIVVKSWEPPILDFFDFAKELEEQNSNSKIIIYLLGLNGKAKSEDIDIWSKKIKELNLDYEVAV